ncbi:acyltransferase [Undibacterium sp. Jales W-56]|uniref:acyltransferase family protein n=1 Tax=Undibacterium sp. Jales W-56 TaxID=2897325 RepID=UPI0021D381C9|nr:acyltransferase [Undibacterium sp. Jales W-56]MCU6435778.1 acyltransferase [Undibacterium sp. Jales W-56]
MNDRHIWVDYARGIGIMLVVYAHVARGLRNAGLPLDKASYMLIDSVIYSFHMSLFFFLSGLFFLASLDKYGAGKLMRGKVATIVYPYLIWSLLQGFIEVSLSAYTNAKTSVGEVLALLWMPRAHFWFLYVLFLIFGLAVLVYRQHQARRHGMIILSAAAFWVLHLYLALPFPFDYLANYFIFFVLGISVPSLLKQIEARPALYVLASLSIFIALQTLFHRTLHLIYTDHSLLLISLSCSGIILVTSMSMWLSRMRFTHWLGVIGQYSLPIYLMHILAASGTRIILSKIMHIDDVATQLLLACLAGILLPMLVYRCAQMPSLRLLDYLFTPPKCWSIGVLRK